MSWHERYYAKHTRTADFLGDLYDKRYPVLISLSHGNCFSLGPLGQGGGQRGDIQNDLTGVQHADRRHDWVPVWYQTEPRRND
jgi:hypothetical protein